MIAKKKLAAKSLKFKKEMAVVIGDLKKIHQKAASTVNTLEVVEPIVEPVKKVDELSIDDIGFFTFCGVLVFTAIYAFFENKRSSNKDTFQFELDSEKCPVPTQKENKKTIKKTLKNIMNKNNGKASLISQ